MPYPSALFIREKALVVNLEAISMIICRNQVYLLSVPSIDKPTVGTVPTPECSFVKDLIHRLATDGAEITR